MRQVQALQRLGSRGQGLFQHAGSFVRRTLTRPGRSCGGPQDKRGNENSGRIGSIGMRGTAVLAIGSGRAQRTEEETAMASKVTRRNALKLAGAGAASGILANSGINGVTAKPLPARQDVHEIVHWSWLTASDGEVWQQMIAAFNEAHVDQGVQIRM